MALYHPLSRASSQRDVSGCITPTGQFETKLFHQIETNEREIKDPVSSSSSLSNGNFIIDTNKQKQHNHHQHNHQQQQTQQQKYHEEQESKQNSKSLLNRSGNILSPPLSPYQRANSNAASTSEISVSAKVYISSGQFKIENYKEYDLVVNPWQNLDSNYKERQFKFLEQYSIISSKESFKKPLHERRSNFNSARKAFNQNNSDSDSEFERVRTRRIVKEASVNLSEYDGNLNQNSTNNSTSPKRRKTSKPASYASSPLAVQQAALIDENIPDYSPDTSTLPKGNNRCLKVEWKGQPMDLKFDPNLDKLHPAEALLASILRLPCNVFLDSKRRLFYEKVNRLKKGQQFRRTDAQKACRIDVNKASRLFAAFEKVGWLEDDHFVKYT